MSYLMATKDGTQYRFSLGSASDKTSGLFPAVKTHNTANGNFSGLLSNVTLYAGRTYYVKVKFRTRGDGNSTSSKCSSVGFIAFWNNWGRGRSYIHNSATAYAEIGKIVEWTYSFTVDSDVTPQGTALYFIINNGWGNGNDAQTIDLFYYKYWDSLGNVYDEDGYLGQNIVSKWSDGSDISSEKSVINSTSTENFLWSEIVNPRKMPVGEIYTIDFDAKISGDVKSVEVYLYSSDYPTKGFITNKGIGKPPSEYYARYSYSFLFSKKSDSSTLPNLRIRFDNNGVSSSGNTGTLFVRNVKLRHGRLEKPAFLKLDTAGGTFYEKLYSSGRLKITKDNTVYYLRQSVAEYKYSELTNYSYANLTGYFRY